MAKKYQMSPLSEAYAKKGKEGIEELLRQGVDINVVDTDKRTVLMVAVTKKDIPTVEFLLKKGADVNAQDSGGWTALAFAAQNNSVEIIKHLLKYAPKMDSRDEYGNTPLWRATFNSRGEGGVIKLLLDNGADRNIKNESGVSPLELARTIANYNVHQFFE